MQVYLFDHQILVATTADDDGFYHFKLGIKVCLQLHKLRFVCCCIAMYIIMI